MSKPTCIWAKLPGADYPIHIGENLLKDKALWARYLQAKQVFILSQAPIAKEYLAILQEVCFNAGARQVDKLLLPVGDKYKTLAWANRVWSALLHEKHHRDTTIIALGGGMVGDLAGFCAACYLRGVNFIQCPTSLLAQIDAAIGGKTAVNYPQAKNMVGVFYQPRAVISDTKTLLSLPEREYAAGLAELIKVAIIFDVNLFEWLESQMKALVSREPIILQLAIERACRLKVEIISQDPLEKTGSRIRLNFGHTIAHALESLYGYQDLLHGEAVALGMIVATHISVQQGRIAENVLERLILLLEKASLPIHLAKKVPIVEILTKMKHDKKQSDQSLRWVLLQNLGESLVCEDVTEQQINRALVKCGASL